MLLQAMVLIATMVVLAGVLLTSSLTSAHAAFNEMILAKTQTATSDATARFATWAQDRVVRYGTEQSWPTTSQPTNPDKTVGVTTSVCNGSGAAVNAAAPCSMTATMRWNVTGWSASALARQNALAPGSIVTNLSTTLHEQRISATITIVLTNPTSHVIYATHSRKVTARIFDAYPYVAVTALRDASSENLTATSMEGDTAGIRDPRTASISASNIPDRGFPTRVVDTQIHTTIDCKNSAANSNQSLPMLDTNVATYVRIRDVGNQAWVYEAPCRPTYAKQIDSTNAPSDYRASVGNTYTNDTVVPSTKWQKEHVVNTFAR